MARAAVLAAGGIVLRQASPPLIAVVHLRKRNEWVLPKGKLDDGETPRDAAEREVNEETGHDVTVHEFLGTLVYESGGRSKVVHYWRMEANGGPAYDLTSDVREVDWLPLDAALGRLSRGYERAFLANVGPLALQAAASNGARAKAKSSAPNKRLDRPPVPAQPSPGWPPVWLVDPSESVPASPEPEHALAPDPLDPGMVKVRPDAVIQAGRPQLADDCATATVETRHKSLVERLRDLFRRAV